MTRTASHALWALTAGGAALADRTAAALGGADLYLRRSLPGRESPHCRIHHFDRLLDAVGAGFHRYRGHVFFMAAGIVVRMIAPHLQGKTVDPAVVVVDERARYAVSLLSGHIGGANALAQTVAERLGARPVITTASDVNRLPAVDLLAVEQGLAIENPETIKFVQGALLDRRPVKIYDPGRWLAIPPSGSGFAVIGDPALFEEESAGVFVDDIRVDLPPRVLVLRPGSLAAGIGCNRGTAAGEIEDLLAAVFEKHRLATPCLRCLATVSLKKDETGLLALAEKLGIPVRFYEKDELRRVPNIPNPSAMAVKHIGVESVCEAAAILASEGGRLIVTKHTSPNATVAVARAVSTSSASDPVP